MDKTYIIDSGIRLESGVRGDVEVEVKKQGFLKKAIVYLRGTVKNQVSKDTAERIAKSHADGMKVENQIVVAELS